MNVWGQAIGDPGCWHWVRSTCSLLLEKTGSEAEGGDWKSGRALRSGGGDLVEVTHLSLHGLSRPQSLQPFMFEASTPCIAAPGPCQMFRWS